MNEYAPKIQPQPDDNFVKGNPVYDKAAKAWTLVDEIARHVYAAPTYQEYNPYYATINDNLNNTIANMDEFDREEFDEHMSDWPVKMVKATRPVYSEKPKDWKDTVMVTIPNPEQPAMVPMMEEKDGKQVQVKDKNGNLVFTQDIDNWEEEITVEQPNPFQPEIVGEEEYETTVEDWEGLLVDVIAEAGGWPYEIGMPVVPFKKTHMAPYHYKNAIRALRIGCQTPAKLEKKLGLKIEV